MSLAQGVGCPPGNLLPELSAILLSEILPTGWGDSFLASCCIWLTVMLAQTKRLNLAPIPNMIYKHSPWKTSPGIFRQIQHDWGRMSSSYLIKLVSCMARTAAVVCRWFPGHDSPCTAVPSEWSFGILDPESCWALMHMESQAFGTVLAVCYWWHGFTTKLPCLGTMLG